MEFVYKYWTELDVKNFSRILSHKTNSHKFYFFPVIIDAINNGEKCISFSDIANRMIALAWYPVLEHHIHLGQFLNGIPKDTIEQAIVYLQSKLNVSANIGKDILIKKIQKLEEKDENVTVYKNAILKYAPTRLLSPFLKATEEDYKKEERIYKIISETSITNPLPYILEFNSSIEKRKVLFNSVWKDMIVDNYIEIMGWINNERLSYLQKRNPEMPGIVFKMQPYQRDRKLKSVRELWSCLLNDENLLDIYTGEQIDIEDFHIDHFIPWSYVACDELWNLCPIGATTNISKSNNLPKEEFISRFVDLQFHMYERVLVEKKRKCADMNYSSELLSRYEKCKDNHIWAVWANEELYTDNIDAFKEVLTKNIKQVYSAALSQGYRIWNNAV